jgi:hypothetical protein
MTEGKNREKRENERGKQISEKKSNKKKKI